MEGKIRQIVKSRRASEAEVRILRTCIGGNKSASSSSQQRRLEHLERRIEVIDGWLMLTTEVEAFVLKRHLVDHVEWPRVTAEYNKIWSGEHSRSERTLKSKQQSGVKAIVKFVQQHKEMLSDILNDDYGEIIADD